MILEKQDSTLFEHLKIIKTDEPLLDDLVIDMSYYDEWESHSNMLSQIKIFGS